jgi:hypothetical protein
MAFNITIDELGIPWNDYGEYNGLQIGRQRSALAVAERGLYYWNKFNLDSGPHVLLSYDWSRYPVNSENEPDGPQSAKVMMRHCADWLLENIADRGNFGVWIYPYPFSYNTRPGWRSAQTQAVGLQLLLRQYALTDDSRYLIHFDRLLNAFDVKVEDGGLLDIDSAGIPWFEKFADANNLRPRILNGMLFALIGLHDVSAAHFSKARVIFDKGIESVLNSLTRYDLGDWSSYDILGKRSSLHYHKIHIAQLDLLFRATSHEKLKQIRDRFHGYQMNMANQTNRKRKCPVGFKN